MIRIHLWIVVITVALSLAGCAKSTVPAGPKKPARAPEESVSTIPSPAPSTPKPVKTPPKKPSPRALAALELTEQGRSMIKDDRADDAIRVLERALNLYPKDGKVYYYLAEAWLLKGNLPQAAEFNRLAGIYLQKDPQWVRQVEQQRITIEKR